jgi:predicted amidohydrolase
MCKHVHILLLPLPSPAFFSRQTLKTHRNQSHQQAWVIAPAQWGKHDDKGLRQSYGHSVIIDPWGTVVAECGDGEGYCIAPMNLSKVDSIRAQIPIPQLRRLNQQVSVIGTKDS